MTRGEETGVEIRDVHHAYRQRVVLRGVDLRLRAGTLCGIVGENGAGKSTLLKILSGELRPTHGSVRHSGRFGYCPQHVVLNDALTVRQHLTFFQTAYRLTDVRYAEEIMDVLGFTGYADERAGVLSGGTRQKLNVTLMHDPQVLLLDEPYQGFDWDTYQRFWDLAARLRDAGRSVLVVSHLAYDTGRMDELWRLDSGMLRAERAGAAA
jgi:ABC-type multidrug transport system ATPase subunit